MAPTAGIVAAQTIGSEISMQGITTSWADVGNLTIGTEDMESLFSNIQTQIRYYRGATYPITLVIRARLRHGSDYYPHSDGIPYSLLEADIQANNPECIPLSWFVTVPKNMSGETIYLQMKIDSLGEGTMTLRRCYVTVWGHSPHTHR